MMNRVKEQSGRFGGVRGGYTLVELLIVVALLGGAAAMVIPSMGSAGVLRVQSAVRTVVADITYAQMDALAYQEERAVLFNTDNNMYTLTRVDEDIDPLADALFDSKGPGQRYEVSLDEPQFGGSFIENVNFNGGEAIIFDELGAPIASPGSTTVSDGGFIEVSGMDSRFRIRVEAFTGRVSVTRLE